MYETITELDIVIRLCLAFIAGGIIGFERSSRRQVAGLRTHILISVGAACLMMLSVWLPEHLSGPVSGDPGRIAAQVVSGMGFLGAGAIIRLGKDVKGLTTAASLWLVAAIGMTIGAGMFVAALTAEILAIITLISLNKVERKIFPDVRHKLLDLYYHNGSEPNTDAVLEVFKKFYIKSSSVSIDTGENENKTKVQFQISILDTVDTSKLISALKDALEIDRVEIKEKLAN